MNEAIVRCRNLSKSFPIPGGGENKVLKGIDLEVSRGEFIALMGPSGCGKSTLLNIIGAMLSPTAGEVEVNGRSLKGLKHMDLTRTRRHEVGWIFQDFNLIPNLTALENVMIPMYIAGKISSEAEDRVKSLIARLGLADRMDHFPDGLSGGQQQRIAVARALVNDPPLVVADEPTGNLDTNAGLEIIELFSELAAAGKAILMVTHDIDLAQAAHTRYVLRQGRLHMSLNEGE
jgi:putative ABC transport system ATP-binding protein